MIRDSMRGHLIGQFDNKPVFAAVIDAIGAEIDEIETAYSDLINRRWIDTGEGVQLDGIGEIVAQPRQMAKAVQLSFFGFLDQANTKTFGEGRFRDRNEEYLASATLADPEYRLVLWQKVAKNTSRGTAEDTINSIGFVFDNAPVILEEKGNAKIAVAIGKRLTPNEIMLADAVDLVVKDGGVGLVWKEYFDHESYFGFLGQPNAKGFDVGTFADVF